MNLSQTVPDERFFRRRLPKIRPLLAQLQPFLRPGVKVLEVGCSVGALLWSMREKVGATGTFVGVEPHEGHAKFAREAKGLDVRIGLLDEISHKLKPASFDLIMMNHVLEHTISPTDVLLTCKKLLKPHCTWSTAGRRRIFNDQAHRRREAPSGASPCSAFPSVVKSTWSTSCGAMALLMDARKRVNDRRSDSTAERWDQLPHGGRASSSVRTSRRRALAPVNASGWLTRASSGPTMFRQRDLSASRCSANSPAWG
ncbi:MAG: class I SAM-dependent methyltransferase [Verrucomicrobia bacterium]|nr:class I SAM-dependent methyltransferase [Verrucomicrobiota bacterium]